MANRILLYGDVIFDYIDGSSVWLINLAKLLSQDNNNQVDILLKRAPKKDVLTSELDDYSNISMIKSQTVKATLNSENIVEAVGEVDGKNNYDCIIVRGLEVAKSLTGSRFKSKLIPYITDFNQNADEISSEETRELSAIYDSVDYMFVQTEEMKDYFMNVLDVSGEKCSILNPIVFPLEKVEKEPKTICYAGKLSKLWYIEELIEIMSILNEKDPQIKLYFIGSKFNPDLNDKNEEILSQLRTAPNIEFIPELSNIESRKIINKCKMGYCFRSEEIDNDSSLELSTKFLEYGIYGVAPIVRKTSMFSKIIGEDYPLYVCDVEDASSKILDYFNDEPVLDLEDKFSDYTADRTYQNIKPVLDYYTSKNKDSIFKRVLNKLVNST